MACDLPFFVKSSLNLHGLVFIFVKKVYHTYWCKQNSMDKDLKAIHAFEISKFCNSSSRRCLKCMQSHNNKLFSR